MEALTGQMTTRSDEDGPVRAERPGQVVEATEELERGVKQLHEAVDMLEARVAPYLRPEDDCVGELRERQVRVEPAQHIADAAAAASNLAQRLHNIRDRFEG